MPVQAEYIDEDAWLYSGQWAGLISSNVDSIRFNFDQKNLFVRFNNNSVYYYAGVSAAVARAMFKTGSPGRFVWRRLRGKYPYARIR